MGRKLKKRNKNSTASFQGRGVERLADEQRAYKELENKLRYKELELDILSCLLKDRQVKYEFMEHNKLRYSLEMMAHTLHVSVWSYYDYVNKLHIKRAMKRDGLCSEIQRSYAAAKGLVDTNEFA